MVAGVEILEESLPSEDAGEDGRADRAVLVRVRVVFCDPCPQARCFPDGVSFFKNGFDAQGFAGCGFKVGVRPFDTFGGEPAELIEKILKPFLQDGFICFQAPVAQASVSVPIGEVEVFCDTFNGWIAVSAGNGLDDPSLRQLKVVPRIEILYFNRAFDAFPGKKLS